MSKINDKTNDKLFCDMCQHKDMCFSSYSGCILNDIEDILDADSLAAHPRLLDDSLDPFRTNQDLQNILSTSSNSPESCDAEELQHSLRSSTAALAPFPGEHSYFSPEVEYQIPILYSTPPRDNDDDYKNVQTNGQLVHPLEMLVEPQAFYRGRYRSETDQGKRPWRLIQGASSDNQAAYPVVKLPSWCRSDQQLYIRVTLVTVKSPSIPYHCIHPYPIDTPDENVILEKQKNSIYFPLTESDIRAGEKSFRIRIIKLKVSELMKCEPIPMFDHDELACYNTHVDTPREPKKLIDMYGLTQSQFVFTLAQREANGYYPKPDFDYRVESQVMFEKNNTTQNRCHEAISEESNDSNILCVPQQGKWEGGETMVIIMPRPIDTTPTIYFNCFSHGLLPVNEIELIKPKTIRFLTPPCPYPIEEECVKVLINIQREGDHHLPIEFEYIAPMENILAKRLREFEGELLAKRFRQNSFTDFQFDTAQGIVEKMGQLSIEKKPNTHENDANMKKYFNQLHKALDTFIRTNNPSQLFRRTRMLVTTELTNAHLLHDAIEHGESATVLALIEQLIEMRPASVLLDEKNERGETPLLVAAKMNEGKMIECLLRKEMNYASDRDNDGNNLFHLLAKVEDDQGSKTIENLQKILSDEVRVRLVNEKNDENQTPMDVAKAKNNDLCAQFFSS